MPSTCHTFHTPIHSQLQREKGHKTIMTKTINANIAKMTKKYL
ncbi:hypothetical protein GBAR_LOCUS27746 [Geodia barretti]|uniref:Uncharacterized protein n=1 Tax=Geodia barretti TaxID=519541 RepID=A0AA35X9K9_GEOBA|nr:hypothetical protein GBAR_LOCUS27746 [Geodia barretti]